MAMIQCRVSRTPRSQIRESSIQQKNARPVLFAVHVTAANHICGWWAIVVTLSRFPGRIWSHPPFLRPTGCPGNHSADRLAIYPSRLGRSVWNLLLASNMLSLSIPSHYPWPICLDDASPRPPSWTHCRQLMAFMFIHSFQDGEDSFSAGCETVVWLNRTLQFYRASPIAYGNLTPIWLFASC
jgi:hypothetical protein